MKYWFLAGISLIASGYFGWRIATTSTDRSTFAGNEVALPVRAAELHRSSATPGSSPAVPSSVGQKAAGAKAPDPLAATVPSEISQASPVVPALAAAEELPDGPETAPGLSPAVVLENMRSAFRQYTLRFGANPVGNNLEISQALAGGNARQVNFLQPDDGLRLNARGEIVDNWGTPYFFHQLSGTVMEIRSAGPDRKLWTADDLVLK